jgi:hypothetical protein
VFRFRRPFIGIIFATGTMLFSCPLVQTASAQEQPDLVLPFAPGVISQCTQGPGGDYSHDGVTTANALDFALPEDTLVKAAADGVAYVFFDVPDPSFKPDDCLTATSKSFGNHVKIAHANGFFTIYAHLKTIQSGIDGVKVSRDDPIGTVDSTGWSCGNHIHFGLQQGDASQLSAGTSVAITKLFARLVPNGTPEVMSGSDFVCGPTGVGQRYESVRASLINPEPFSLSDGLASAEYAQILADGNTVYVVWSENRIGNYDIAFRRSTDAGSTWGPRVTLSGGIGQSMFPQMAVSGSNVFVVWGNFTSSFTQQTILFRHSADSGASFGPTQILSATPGTFPIIAASGSNVYAAWTGTGFTSFLRRSNDSGTTFQAIQTFTSVHVSAVAADGATLYVTGYDSLGQMLFARSTDGGANFGPILHPSLGTNAQQIVTNGSNVFLVGQSFSNDIFFVRSTDGGTSFGASLNLSNNGQSAYPWISVSGTSVFVAWMGAQNPIFLRRSTNLGQSFEAAINISGSAGHPVFPSIGSFGTRVDIVWDDSSDGSVRLGRSFDNGLSFGAPITVGSGSALTIVGQVGEGAGHLYVIWEGSPGGVLFRRFD